MKVIKYKKEEFVLTDEEFVSAVKAWAVKKSIWVDRLEQLLSPYFEHAGTPKEFLGKTIYTNNGHTFFTKDNNAIFYLDKKTKEWMLTTSAIDKIKDELVDVDTFLKNKKSLMLK